MNDSEFQNWSEELSQLRKDRRDWLSSQIKSKKVAFTASEFYQEAIRNLGMIADRWWSLEESSEDRRQAPKEGEAGQFKDEMESLVHFELDAIEQDLEYAIGQIPWDKVEIEEQRTELKTFAEQIKSSFHIKIDAFFASAKNEEIPSKGFDPFPSTEGIPTSSNKPIRSSGGTVHSGGVSLIGMFVVGLILGSGISLYIWSSAKKEHTALYDELSSLKSKNKDLETLNSSYQKNYLLFVQGKMKNIPQLEQEIGAIRSRYAEKRRSAKKRSEIDALNQREQEELSERIGQLNSVKELLSAQ